MTSTISPLSIHDFCAVFEGNLMSALADRADKILELMVHECWSMLETSGSSPDAVNVVISRARRYSGRGSNCIADFV